MKNIRFFFSENFQFLVVKFSIYLNRRVFVMTNHCLSPRSYTILGFAIAPEALYENVVDWSNAFFHVLLNVITKTRPWAHTTLKVTTVPEALYQRPWTGPMLFSTDCLT